MKKGKVLFLIPLLLFLLRIIYELRNFYLIIENPTLMLLLYSLIYPLVLLFGCIVFYLKLPYGTYLIVILAISEILINILHCIMMMLIYQDADINGVPLSTLHFASVYKETILLPILFWIVIIVLYKKLQRPIVKNLSP